MSIESPANSGSTRAPDRRAPRAFAGVAFAAIAVAGTSWVASVRAPSDVREALAVRGKERMRPASGATIRVGTYNIRGARGRDDVRDVGRIARTLQGLDLVGLQEIHGTPWSGDEDQCGQLGNALGMASLFAPAEQRWGANTFGNGLLTRVPLSSFHRIPLPGSHPEKFRNALLASTTLAGRTVRVLVTHLDDADDHDAQLAAVIDLFVALDEPALLLGDLNTFADDPQLVRLKSRPDVTAAIGEEWPDRDPLRSVDWIIARGLRCARSQSRDLGGSDHAAIVAELQLIGQSERDESRPSLVRGQLPNERR